MRVKLERGYTKARVKLGLFFSKEVTTSDIRLTVDFTEGEKSVIASGLDNFAVFEIPIDPLIAVGKPKLLDTLKGLGLEQVSVASLLKAPSHLYRFKSLVEANQGEAAIKAGLQTLKQAIDANSQSGTTGTQVFEL